MPIADSCFSLPKRDLERLWGKLQEHLRTTLISWVPGFRGRLLELSKARLPWKDPLTLKHQRAGYVGLLCCAVVPIRFHMLASLA